jgi:hypothetical protein
MPLEFEANLPNTTSRVSAKSYFLHTYLKKMKFLKTSMYGYYILGFGTVWSAAILTDISEECTAYTFSIEAKKATSINLLDKAVS